MNIFCIYYSYSWMLQSSDVYSSFVLVQLISLAISLACVSFELDLVIRSPSHIAYQNMSKTFDCVKILAIQTLWI